MEPLPTGSPGDERGYVVWATIIKHTYHLGSCRSFHTDCNIHTSNFLISLSFSLMYATDERTSLSSPRLCDPSKNVSLGFYPSLHATNKNWEKNSFRSQVAEFFFFFFFSLPLHFELNNFDRCIVKKIIYFSFVFLFLTINVQQQTLYHINAIEKINSFWKEKK